MALSHGHIQVVSYKAVRKIQMQIQIQMQSGPTWGTDSSGLLRGGGESLKYKHKYNTYKYR